MATRTARLTQVDHRGISLPYIFNEILRKDLWISTIILVPGLAITILIALSVLNSSLLLIVLSFVLISIGGSLLLVRLGELA